MQQFRCVPSTPASRFTQLNVCSGNPDLPAEHGLVGAWTGGSHYQLVEFDTTHRSMYEPAAAASASSSGAEAKSGASSTGIGAGGSSALGGGGGSSRRGKSSLMAEGVTCQCKGKCTTASCRCKLNKKDCSHLCHYDSHKSRPKLTSCQNCDEDLRKEHATRLEERSAAKETKPTKKSQTKPKGTSAAGSDDESSDQETADDGDSDWRSQPAAAAAASQPVRSLPQRSIIPTIAAALGRVNELQRGAGWLDRSASQAAQAAAAHAAVPASAGAATAAAAAAAASAVAAARSAESAASRLQHQQPLQPVSLFPSDVLSLRASLNRPDTGVRMPPPPPAAPLAAVAPAGAIPAIVVTNRPAPASQ